MPTFLNGIKMKDLEKNIQYIIKYKFDSLFNIKYEITNMTIKTILHYSNK